MPSQPGVKIILRCPHCDRWNASERRKCKGHDRKTKQPTGCGKSLTMNGLRFWWLLWYETPGRPKRRRIGWSSNALAAQATQKELQTQLTEGRAISAESRLLFEEFIVGYIEKHIRKKKSANTDIRYINRRMLPAWRGRLLTSLTRSDVIRVVDEVAATAPISANRLLALITHMFNWAIGRGSLTINPAQGIPRPGKETKRVRILSDAEIRWMWEATADNSAASQLLRMILITAQRGGEVGGMRFEHLNMENRVWTIANPKNDITHSVPLTPMALEVILSRPFEADEKGRKAGMLFPTTYGGKLRSRYYAQKLEEQPPSEDGRFKPHDLRRTAATMIAALGHTAMVKPILNHVDNSVTATYNLYAYDNEKRKALEAWNKRLRAIIAGEGKMTTYS